MNSFPKKYNRENIKVSKEKKESYSQILYSNSIPLNQKLNPGCIFSLYYKDMYTRIQNIFSKDIGTVNTYNMSSNYFALLNDNHNKAKSELSKNLKNNISFLEKLGLSFDDKDNLYALSENFNRYIRKIFVDLSLHEKISSSQQITYRSNEMQTNFLKNNIIEKNTEVEGYTIKYFIEAKGQTINIPTTRIESLFGDVAIAVNPIDKRYKKLVGQNVIVPIINKNIPIIADESVDMCIGEGAIRITPAHDERSLEIAKKNGLPTNIYSFDTNGYFTENAGEFQGKKVSEFLENIVKYVEDIGNMENQYTTKEIRYFDSYTGNELVPMSLCQWNINYDYAKDVLAQLLLSDDLFYNGIGGKGNLLNILDTEYNNVISNSSSNGILIPVIFHENDSECFAINDDVIISRYESSKNKKDIVMTLIILNLILDNNLPNTFTIQDLIDILYSRDFFSKTTKLEKYLEIYENEGKINGTYKIGIKSVRRLMESIDKNIENVSDLIDILKNSFAIHFDDENISINYNELFNTSGLYLQRQDCFNKAFIDSCLSMYCKGLVYSSESYNNLTKDNNIFLSTNQEKYLFFDEMLLNIEYAKVVPYMSYITHPYLLDFKKQKINNYNSKFLNKDFYENLKIYGPDSLRLTLLLGDTDDEGNVIFDTYKTNYYNTFLNKIWNANRYIYTKCFDDNCSKINIEELSDCIQGDITDYDIWMLHNVKILLDEYMYESSESNYLNLGKKVFDLYSNNFCDKYINITKILGKGDTNKCLVFIGLIFLNLLSPYIPNTVLEIESKFGIKFSEIKKYTLSFVKGLELKEKNYKTNIFMDIIDKINVLKEKAGIRKHELVDVFVQSNPDFLEFLKEHENIFRTLVKVNIIDLFKPHEEIPSGYSTDNVINISLGIKKIEKLVVEAPVDTLKLLQTEYDEKNEHLHHLKSLLASVSSTYDGELLEKKKQDIQNLQAELDDLAFEISKLKIK